MPVTNWSSRLRSIALSLVVGCVFVSANFGGILHHLSESEIAQRFGVSSALNIASQMSKAVSGTSNSTLYQWLVICFWGFWVYLGAVLVLTLARWRPSIAGYAAGGLLVGLFSLPIFSWLGLLVVDIFWILGVILSFLSRIFHAITDFVVWLFALAWPVLAVAAAVCVVVLLWKSFGPVRRLAGVAGAVVLYLLGPALRIFYERILLPILRWIGAILQTVFGWLAVVVLWLVKAVLLIAGVVAAIGIVVGTIGSLGQVVVDQMRTAWEAGRSRKGILIGSFSLGSSLALILLVSAGAPESQATSVPAASGAGPMGQVATKSPAKKKKGKKKVVRAAPVYIPPPPPPPISDTVDRAWHSAGWVLQNTSLAHAFSGTLPAEVRAWAQRTFKSASAPIFDAVLLAVALGLSIIGTLRGVLARKEIPLTVTFYRRDLVGLVALPLLLIVAVFAASDGNQG
jgi:hypothetical protein